jgi:hypothetical protein
LPQALIEIAPLALHPLTRGKSKTQAPAFAVDGLRRGEQIPRKSQTPNPNESRQASEREFVNWRLEFVWDLLATA